MKKISKVIAVILSAAMVFSFAFAASAADPGYEEYAGYQFVGSDPWGGQLSVTVRSVANGLMEWTFTDLFEDGMIYKELERTEIKEGCADFYLEGNYSESDNLIYNYGGSIQLIEGYVVIEYEYGETVTQSPEGDSNSRQVDALPDDEKIVVLEKYVPNGGVVEDYSYFEGYQFTGVDPWGGALNITIRSIENGEMDWTITDSYGNEMIYNEKTGTELEAGQAGFYIEGDYTGADNMSYAYGGTLDLIDRAIVFTYEFGATVTSSSEGGSSSRMVDALPDSEKIVILTRHVPSGGVDGWQYIDGKWYYASNGEWMTDWINDGYAWYYLDTTGAMQTGWLLFDGEWYYLCATGEMATGWIFDGWNWYYMDIYGVMTTGWLYDGGYWYYLTESGAMATGWLLVDGAWYLFADSGEWIG